MDSRKFLVLLAFAIIQVNCDEINFYDENGSFSMIRTIGYGGCYKFAPVWDKRATAIDIVEERSCFNVWKSRDCTGESLKLTKKEGSYELRDMNFDKAISAVSLCSWDEQGRPDPNRMLQGYSPNSQNYSPNRNYQLPAPGVGNYGVRRGEVLDRSDMGGYRRNDELFTRNDNYGRNDDRTYTRNDNYGNVQQTRNDYSGNVQQTRNDYSGNVQRTYNNDMTYVRSDNFPPTNSPANIQQSSNDIWDLAVQEHNKYRRQNGATFDIKGNPSVHADAQRYAEELISSNKLQASTLGNKYASNVATSFRRSKSDAVKDAVHRWFTPSVHGGKLNAYDIEATDLGIGAAWSEHEKHWVIVAFYQLPDSFYLKQFHEQNGGNIPSGRPLRTYSS